MNAAVAEALDDFVAGEMAARGPVGMVVAITDRERTLLTRTYGYANLEAGVPVAEDSLFQIGSIGKSFTAFALMVERERGGGSNLLQRPLTDFVPWFDPPTKVRPITLHDLLTHSAGLALGTESHQESMAEAWSLRRQAPGHAPGTNTSYSNLGYKLLGFVLERFAGQRYAEAIAQRVFTPIGMASSYARITDDLRPYTAVGYRRLHRDRPASPNQPFVPADWIVSESGDGSVTSTAPDMSAYVRMIMSGGQTPTGQVVDAASFDLMTRRYFEDREEPGHHYGYGLMGWDADGHRMLGHTGTMVAHRAEIQVDLDAGLGIVVLASSSGIDRVAGFAMALAQAAHAGVPLPPPPPAAGPIPGGPEAFAGTFTCDGRTLNVLPDAAALTAEIEGAEVPLQWRGSDAFLGEHPSLDRFLLRAVRESERVIAYTHGPDLWEGMTAHGGTAQPPPEWSTYAGTYRSYNPWRSVFHVVLRAGRLHLIDPEDSYDPGELEEPLVPLPDGVTFRIGAEEWQPGRLTFGPIVGGTALHATRDGGVYDRVA